MRCGVPRQNPQNFLVNDGRVPVACCVLRRNLSPPEQQPNDRFDSDPWAETLALEIQYRKSKRPETRAAAAAVPVWHRKDHESPRNVSMTARCVFDLSYECVFPWTVVPDCVLFRRFFCGKLNGSFLVRLLYRLCLGEPAQTCN